MIDSEELDDWSCWNCGGSEPPIFLCEAGWWCEACYREWSGVPEDLPSQELHDGINDGSQSGYIEVIKDKVFGVYEDEMGE